MASYAMSTIGHLEYTTKSKGTEAIFESMQRIMVHRSQVCPIGCLVADEAEKEKPKQYNHL